MENPLISVIIPTRNEEKYIKTLLSEIKRQTYKNYEILVCDYKSTDNTVKISKKLGATVIPVKRKGISAGRNAGIKKAKGKIIAFIDADYEIPPTLFESVVDQLNDPKNKDVVGIVPPQKADLKGIPRKKLRRIKLIGFIYETVYTRMRLLTKLPFGCVFCREEAVKRAGLFNEKITVSEDIEYYSRILKYGRFILGKKYVKMSMRRFKKEGFVRAVSRYFDAFIAVKLGRRYRGDFEHVDD